jgi:hypothetical protein
MYLRHDDAATLDYMNDDDDRLGLDSYRNIDCVEFDTHEQLYDFFSYNSKSCLKIFHMNIRSYSKNVDALLILLESLQVEFDLIVLTEAWLDEGKPLLSLNSYQILFTDRYLNRNDGVIVYYKSYLCAIAKQVILGEATALQINFDFDGKDYCITAIYRSPSTNCQHFLSDLKFHISEIRTHSHMLIGDINIDLLGNTDEGDECLNILYTFGLVECINKPTRVTEHSITCIDHIFIKHYDYSTVSSGVLKTDITDHYAVVAKVELTGTITVTDPSTTTATYLDMREMHGLIETQSWDHVLALQDVNDSCNAFMDIIANISFLSTKVKKPSTRYKKLKSWITINLIQLIRQRDKMSKTVKRNPHDIQLRNRYISFRNSLSKEIKSAKILYYREQILQSTGNPKKFWRVVNEVGGVKAKHNIFPIKYFSNVAGSNGAREVANRFNDFFSNVGSSLAQLLPPTNAPPLVNDSVFGAGHEFRLEKVTDSQIESCVAGMRGGSAPGFDNVTALMLKTNLRHLLVPLKHIINLSLEHGVFPENFKTAKVIPLFKSGTKSDFNNYRPISLLSVISKVLERCVKSQLQDYLENCGILAECQFGFRRSKSTSDALFAINKTLSDSISNGNRTLLVFVDLAKAFDSIDRKLLLSKMECVGITGVALKWFRSYLTGRKQMVTINNTNSNILEVEYGVVQGSTLGPILFSIYINNLNKLPISGKFFLFADDTAVVFSGRSWELVYENAATDMRMIHKWFSQNILTMNTGKTKCMPIALRPMSEPPAHLQLVLHSCDDSTIGTCDCRVIERVNYYKYLGVTIDSKLRWEHHINSLKSKLRKLIYVFTQLNQILNENEIKTVYFSFAQSNLLYGILVWGGANKTLIESLFIIQKLIIKSAFNKHRRYSTELLFRETKLLSLRQLYIKTILIFIYNHKEQIVTPVTHHYNTRAAANVGAQVPRVVKSVNLSNVFYVANFIYRNIPQWIRNLQVSIHVFKRVVTQWLQESGLDRAESLISSVYLQ